MIKDPQIFLYTVVFNHILTLGKYNRSKVEVVFSALLHHEYMSSVAIFNLSKIPFI